MKIESIASFYDMESPEATEFRRLYSNIKKSNNDQLKSVLVTSSTIEEGKSLISSFLAITMAEAKEGKVLLLDADLRRPMINVLFKLPLEKGLSDILEKKCKVGKTIKDTSISGLKIITAGRISESPTLIFNQENIRKVTEELKFYFDFIIIDAPPVIPVSDPLLIASEVDGVLLVIKAGTTKKEVVKRTTNLLINSNIKILGAVINDFDSVLPFYYSSKYYGYKYYHKKAGGKGE
ncbi:MAG: hypothetical protein B6D58_03075 [candidate division Zixibacteria bacterium 4484_95]|nr:MAG: hypothetical protein B6D58_03075 [candidate division Zixibacteria bacterium 4484_95]RKX20244.1 MAG: hypothetical protein DRP26_02010 [candidate division Zixibacteria bacterium]